MRLVLIEDNLPDRRWFEIVLEDCGIGCELIHFSSGTEALEKLPAIAPPDLIVCDWFLPPMEFPELAAGIRRIPGFERLPILASAIPGLADAAAKAGATACFSKPVDEAQLKQFLDLASL